MKEKIKNFGRQTINFADLIYRTMRQPAYLKRPFYNPKQDLAHNEELLNTLKFNVGEIKSLLKSNNIDYFNPNESWHYHIFAGLRQKYYNPKVLEIGTFDGSFTKFLANIFPDSEITTIDLPDDDAQFNQTYNRHVNGIRDVFMKKREQNLRNPNINFVQIDSIKLLENFKNHLFDLIWLDGDHDNPQVTIDIFSAIKLLKQDGVVCCDDNIKNPHKVKTAYSGSYEALENFDKRGFTETHYFVKRIRDTNVVATKFVSYSVLSKPL